MAGYQKDSLTEENNEENPIISISEIKQELLDESCKGWKRITRLGTLWKWYKQYCLKWFSFEIYDELEKLIEKNI